MEDFSPLDAVTRTSELAAVGREGSLRRELRTGALQRVRSGAYVSPDTWSDATPEERMRLRSRAVDARARSRPVFVGASAAVEHGLPIHGADERRVHTLQRTARVHKSRGDVARHAWPVADDDVVEVGGVLVTSLPRTLYDVSRTLSLEAAVACVDAGLRSVAWGGFGAYDDDAAEDLRGALAEYVLSAGAAPGIRQARFVIAFADGRAQLPGESISRLWMHRLGVDLPLLQLEVALRGGRRAFPDFSWPRRRRFGEFDGDGKYVDPRMTAGRSVRQSLRDQRGRETAVTEATGWLPVRWAARESARHARVCDTPGLHVDCSSSTFRRASARTGSLSGQCIGHARAKA